jgi:PhnB protein
MKIQPYLFFNGCCEEALDFYRLALGAEQIMLMHYRDSPEPPPMPLPTGWENKVMHASLKIGETMLMASDGCGPEASAFQGFSLSLDMPDAATARRAFNALAEGGTVQMPLDKTFFATCFGMLTDRFGVGWMLIVNEQAQ